MFTPPVQVQPVAPSSSSWLYAYVYNQDELDGATGCTCTGGVNTYCDEVPILGVDYFRGPLKPIFDEMGNQIGA